MLSISLPTDFGINAGLWEITNININEPTQTAQVVLVGYIDQAAKDAGKRPVGQRTIYLSGAQFPFDSTLVTTTQTGVINNTTTDTQGKVTTSEFAAATAVSVV